MNSNRLFNWFTTSNRYKHFLYAIPIGAAFTVLAALGAAGGMEFKDHQYGNKFDWIDFLCTVAGGVVGNLITFSILYFSLS